SGGEKRRLHLLTVLFRNPNFLILDEPTNDLDLPTLSVLENFLLDFPGCLLIVSHDRYFMDRLVDHLFVFDGTGEVRDFPGNYSQYREWQKEQENVTTEARKTEPARQAHVSNPQKKKLSYKEQREFEMLEKELADLEVEKKVISEKMLSSSLAFEDLQKLSERIAEISGLIDQKELRWLELSE
ncbi:MAG: ATP-binding cassette domain-containing protein, partial [Flavisolibacter sp.]